MPTYQYACTSCGERLEAVQSFSDDPLTVCPACEGRLRKVFSPVGVVFKGSGFYKTDSRKPVSASAGSSGGAEGAASGSSGSSGSSGREPAAASSKSSDSGSSAGSGGDKAASTSSDSSTGTAKKGGSKVA